MGNYIANLVRILGICKDFASNRINEHRNTPQHSVVHKFSKFEVNTLGIMAKSFGKAGIFQADMFQASAKAFQQFADQK